MLGFLLGVAAAAPTLGVAHAVAEAPQPWAAGALVTAETFTALSPRVVRTFDDTLADRPLAVGVGLDVPLMLWVQGGGIDTGRVVAQVSAEAVRAGRFGLAANAQSRFGLQVDNLGRRLTWDAGASLMPGLHLGRAFLAIDATWHQGLSTHIRHSEATKERFTDFYEDGSATDGPVDGWVAFPSSRWRIGPAVTASVGERWQLAGSIGALTTLRRWDSGPVDAMMIGQWPFAMEVGATVGW